MIEKCYVIVIVTVPLPAYMYHINVNIIRIYPMSQIMSRTNRERKFQGANVPGSEYS